MSNEITQIEEKINIETYNKELYRNEPIMQRLDAFLRSPNILSMATGAKDSRTNIIDLCSNGRPTTYSLSDEALQELFVILNEIRLAKIPVHFLEKPNKSIQQLSGIMLDFDLMVENSKVQLEHNQARKIISRVSRLISKTLDIDSSSENNSNCGENNSNCGEITINAFTKVKPSPKPKDGKYKYGFHILFPGLRVTTGYKKYLIKALQIDNGINKVLEEMGATGDLSNVLDRNSATVAVHFLGSCKNTVREPYLLGPAFKITYERGDFDAEITPINDLENYNMVAELSLCTAAKYVNKTPLVPALKCTPNKTILAEVEKLESNTINVDVIESSIETLIKKDSNARYLSLMLDLLDKSYSSEYDKWRNVIFAIANSSQDYFELAEYFSKKDPIKWNNSGKEELTKIWNDAISKKVEYPLTERSIIYWAKQCNPEKYKALTDNYYVSVLNKYISKFNGKIEHYHVADILYHLLKHRFVVDVDDTMNKKDKYVWFEFITTGQPEIWKWRKETEPDELHKYISNELVEIFEKQRTHLNNKKTNSNSEEMKKYYKRCLSNFNTSILKLYNHSFKVGVISQAAFSFRKRKFIETLDTQEDLLGVGNGVLRLGKKCALIDYFHELPVMNHTPVIYKKFDPEDPWTRKMLSAMEDIIPEADFRNWLLFFAASSLSGGVKDGILLLWHGGGANGKTWFMRMVAKVLGKSYATKLDIGLLTTKRSKPNDPNSAIMQLKGKRWGYVEETQKAEPLNDQRLKELVNPGEISGNDKFQKQETFEVITNIAVGQNYDFIVETKDHGTWRRLKHYHSKIKFCSDPKSKYEKKEDQKFIREYINDPSCQAAFLSILVHYYEILQQKYGGYLKNVPSHTLDIETEKFRNSQDTTNKFITQTIVISPNTNYEYTLPVLADKYKEWYNKNLISSNLISSEIIQDLENSAISNYIIRLENGTSIMRGCRILEGENSSILPGETYFSKVESQKQELDMIEDEKWWPEEETITDEAEYEFV